MGEQTSRFSENDIRPDRLKEGQQLALEHDLQFLAQHRDRFVQVDCPACASGETRPKYEKYSMTYVTCCDCGMVYINPRPPSDLLEEFYCQSENYAYWNRYIFPQSENSRRKNIFEPRAKRTVELCRQHCSSAGTLLEIGAGYGTFCEEIRKLGFFKKIIALEMTPDLAATCRDRGLDVIEVPVEKLKMKPESVDVVTSFEVIEHLFNPEEFLGSVRRFLHPKGLLILSCPSISGFETELLGTQSDTIDHEHLNYFTPDSLQTLLARCGFSLIERFTPGKLDADLVRKKYLAGAVDLEQDKFLRDLLTDGWEQCGEAFQEFLQKTERSSHLWVVARARSSSRSNGRI